jgi:hypothetical protein
MYTNNACIVSFADLAGHLYWVLSTGVQIRGVDLKFISTIKNNFLVGLPAYMLPRSLIAIYSVH